MPTDITKARAKYWATWQQVKRVLARDGSSDAEIEQERHRIHRLALAGRDPSSNDIVANRKDFSAVLAHFDAVLHPDDLGRQLKHQRDADRRSQIIWAIEQLGLPDTYLNALTRDIFKVSNWRTLGPESLHKLRITAKSRARAHAR